MTDLLWRPPDPDDRDPALYFVILTLVFVAVVVLGMMFR